MCDIPHDSVHRPREIDLIFIVHGHANQQFCLSYGRSDLLSQLVPVQYKVIWVAGHGSISHMCELSFISSRQEAVQDGGYLAFEDELAIDKSHLFPGQLCVSNASSPYLAIRSLSIMIELPL